MGENSKIEWTDHTFNPWWGCVKVSPACDHCYAEALAKRYGHGVWGKNTPRRFFGDAHWREPLKWNREAALAGFRRRVFCASMADVMEDREDVKREQNRLWDMIERTPHLDWLLLTKRPQNFRRFLREHWLRDQRPNVWLMTTVESQEHAWRIDELVKVPAVVRGVSYEPALGPIDLSAWLGIKGLNWVIAGGESGPRARPSDPQWFRSVRDQCAITRVPFMFKQWGEHSDGLIRIGKKKAGRLLDGRLHDEYPAVALG